MPPYLQTFLENHFWLAVVGFAVFILLIREVTVWYWKINSILNMLQRIELTLETIERTLKGIAGKIKDK